MKYSDIVTIGIGNFPTIGIVGLCHGDEVVGRKVLDRLQQELPPLQQGKIHLIYANLPAEEAGKRCIETDLNRCFPGRKDGLLEERIAYDLRDILHDCQYVLDIHSTTLPHVPFVISTVGKTTEETRKLYAQSDLPVESRNQEVNLEVLEGLARDTGLGVHVVMNSTVAHGGSLIEFVNAHGNGYSVSFEAGQHRDPASENVAMEVVLNVLRVQHLIPGQPTRREQERYIGWQFIKIPAGIPREEFIPYDLENFKVLTRGTPYGRDATGREYSLEEDCYVLFFSRRKENDTVFLKAQRISG